MIYSLLDAIRLAVYTWGLYEVGMLTSLYYITVKSNIVRDKYSLQVLVFSASVLSMIIFLMLINMISQVKPDMTVILRNGLVFPVGGVALSAKLLRRRYLKRQK